MYFIADIGANHDGDLGRALMLIEKAKKAGANAVKFQHFKAETIVSKEGFKNLKTAHQSKWKSGVYETYKKYALPYEWTADLYNHCKILGINFMSTPYDLEAVQLLKNYVDIYKIGSGDIDYFDLLKEVNKQGKPVILSTGASTDSEVMTAVGVLDNCEITVMQCNTNYTGKDNENHKYLNLNWLKNFHSSGISLHTKDIRPVIMSIALGARYIEHHFTDGRSCSPDNDFALNHDQYAYMVRRSKEAYEMLGCDAKTTQENEKESRVVQRRCWRAKRNIRPGDVLRQQDIEALRPAPQDSISPNKDITGLEVKVNIKKGDYLKRGDLCL